MSTEEMKALVRRAWDEVFNKKNLDFTDEFSVADTVWHEPDRDLHGPEEVKQYAAPYFEAFPDLSVSIDDVIAEGDKVVARWTYHGTHQGEIEELGPPTGRQMELEGITIHHFEGDKIVELWERFDNLSLLQQLGLVPEEEQAESS
jgi:steroid delta-isomerase-like uncharacterized protein